MLVCARETEDLQTSKQWTVRASRCTGERTKVYLALIR